MENKEKFVYFKLLIKCLKRIFMGLKSLHRYDSRENKSGKMPPKDFNHPETMIQQ